MLINFACKIDFTSVHLRLSHVSFIEQDLYGQITDQLHDIEEFIIKFIETLTDSFFYAIIYSLDVRVCKVK